MPITTIGIRFISIVIVCDLYQSGLIVIAKKNQIATLDIFVNKIH